MKNLILTSILLFSFNSFADDYRESTCYKKFQEKSKAHWDKQKKKEETETFGKKVARFFCSVDRVGTVMLSQPGSAIARADDCENPIDYRKQNNAQVILNLSYSEADNLKTTDDENCRSNSPCDNAIFTLGGTDIKGSMDIAKEILTDAKKRNSGITNWRFIQPIVQKGIASGEFCKRKPWSLGKVKRYIRKKVKNESIIVSKKVDDQQRTNKEVSTDSKLNSSQETSIIQE